MRTPALHSAGLLTAGLMLLTACGTDAMVSEDAAVPAGVKKQYSVVHAEIAERGGETTAGDWRIGYIVEAAEPWFHADHGAQHFREPAAGETNHIEVIPFEKATGRIVPDVPVTVEVVDGTGATVAKSRLDFYYATFFHYATNFSIPKGSYDLRVTLGSPEFLRHGDAAEPAPLAEGATVTFEGVALG
jgi:hypothetical protein